MRDYKYKLVYEKGDLLGINNHIFLKELEPRVYIVRNGDRTVKKRHRWALFKCGLCGKEFENEIQRIKSNQTLSCGCYQKKALKKYYEEKK